MDTVYIALVRWYIGWDGQSIYKTSSKALFDQMDAAEDNVYFPSFSDELKADLQARHAQQVIEYPEDTFEPLDEEMSLTEAMEWLGYTSSKYPVIVAGETELTCHWNF